MNAKKPLGILLALVLVLSAVSAAQLNQPDTNQLDLALQGLGFLGSAKVNVINNGTDPATHYGVTVADGKVTGIEHSDLENPNYTATISQNASNALIHSTDPVNEAKAQIKNGGIAVEAHGIIESIQLFLFNIFSGFF